MRPGIAPKNAPTRSWTGTSTPDVPARIRNRPPALAHRSELGAGDPVALRARAHFRHALGRARHHHPPLALAEEERDGGDGIREGHVHADRARAVADRRLDQRAGEPPLGAVVRRAEDPGPVHCEQGLLEPSLGLEVQLRRLAGHQIVESVQVLGAAQLCAVRPEQEDAVAGVLEGMAAHALEVFDHSYHPNHWGRIDRDPLGLIVEGDVPARDRDLERAARLRHPQHGLAQLMVDGRLEGAAEVEVVGHRGGDRSHARQVACRLGHRDRGAAPRVEIAVAPVAVGGGGHPAVGAGDPHDARVAAGAGPCCSRGRSCRTAGRPSAWRRGSGSRAARAAGSSDRRRPRQRAHSGPAPGAASPRRTPSPRARRSGSRP